MCNALSLAETKHWLVGGTGSVVERQSLAGGLSLSCARPAAGG